MGGITVCLTFDLDGISSWIGTAKSNNPSVLSRGEFTVVGTPRVLELLRRKGIHATFFIPGHTAYAFPDLVRRIRDGGHEIGHHGWVHESPHENAREEERTVIEKGLQALQRVAGVQPTGYRAPNCDISRHTLGLLKEYGFAYDSSCFAGDFSPYYARVDDHWGLDEPYRFGSTIDLVEIPLSTALDDFIAFETYLGLIPGYVAPRAVEGMWCDDFDYAAEECPGGCFMPVMHPQCIGRGSRMRMLERVIDHMRECADVTFDTLASYQSRWRARNPMEDWKRANPLRTGVDAITRI